MKKDNSVEAKLSNEEQMTRFLYVLMRDEVPTGVVEKILKNHIVKARKEKAIFSAKHLENYARQLAREILNPDKWREK